ncbi:4954_t:CDS:2, partial [Acaulospora colombiana]
MFVRQNSELPFVSPSLHHAQPYGPEPSPPTSRLHSFITRPVSVHIHNPLHARYPLVASKPRRTDRPRLFSDPSSARSRPSITELEKGYTGQTSASSSRSVSEVGSDETRVTNLMWNSVFEPLKLGNMNTLKRPAASCTESMRRVTSCTSMNSVGSLASVTGYDPHDPRITGKLKEKGSVQLPSSEDGQKFILLLSEALM